MFSRWLKKKIRAQMWTDTQIELYERQMAAREALGTKYKCHPSRDAKRLPTAPCVRKWHSGVEFQYYPPPKLHLVK